MDKLGLKCKVQYPSEYWNQTTMKIGLGVEVG